MAGGRNRSLVFGAAAVCTGLGIRTSRSGNAAIFGQHDFGSTGRFPGRDVAELSDAETGAHFTQGEIAASPVARTERHFRSLVVMQQAAVEATDDEVGHAEDFLVDPADWQIKYLVVRTSDWWSGEKILISSHAIIGIDYTRNILKLDVTRQSVKDGVRFSPEQTVDGAFDESFETYYGIRFVKK